MSEWAEREHEGVRLARPSDWREEDLGPAVAWIEDRDGVEEIDFLANVNLIVDTPDEPRSLDDHFAAQLALCPAQLTDFTPLDIGEVALDAGPSVRMLFVHRHGYFHLTCEQWTLLAGDRLVTLTGTAESLDFPRLHGLFGEIARSLAVDER